MGASESHRLKPTLRKKRPATLLRALEQRFLFDAAAIIDPLALVDASTDQPTQPTNTTAARTTALTSEVSSSTATATGTTSAPVTTESPPDTTTADQTSTAATDSKQVTPPVAAEGAMFVPPSTISPELQTAVRKATDTLRQLPVRDDFRQIIEQSFGRDIADPAAWESAYHELAPESRIP